MKNVMKNYCEFLIQQVCDLTFLPAAIYFFSKGNKKSVQQEMSNDVEPYIVNVPV